MDLSIVIVSYNVSGLLAECLDSVYETLAAMDLAAEVLVIDNASSDDSVGMVRQRYPGAWVQANATNAGFAAATNQGTRRAGGRYVFYLNPDTRLLDGALASMIEFMEAHPGVAMTGPRLVYPDGGFQHSAFRFPTIAQILFDFFPIHHRLTNSPLNGRYLKSWYDRGEPFPIDHPLGAVMLVRREALDDVGLLDERFFMYCEEVDWAMRFHQAGWEIYTVPAAHIVHHAGQSTQQFRDRMFIALWRSRFLLFAKHNGRLFRLAAVAAVRLGLWSEERKLAHVEDEQEVASRRAAFSAVRAIPAEIAQERNRT
jgi:N-acetylglucosaminyl-diphospho-decaprenol L-rhamnosyltransferase